MAGLEGVATVHLTPATDGPKRLGPTEPGLTKRVTLQALKKQMAGQALAQTGHFPAISL